MKDKLLELNNGLFYVLIIVYASLLILKFLWKNSSFYFNPHYLLVGIISTASVAAVFERNEIHSIFKKLDEVHNHIKSKNYGNAEQLYESVKKRYDKLSSEHKKGNVHEKFEKKHKEVQLGLMSNKAFNLALQNNKQEAILLLNSIYPLFNEVSENNPDKEIYQEAVNQYKGCLNIIKNR